MLLYFGTEGVKHIKEKKRGKTINYVHVNG